MRNSVGAVCLLTFLAGLCPLATGQQPGIRDAERSDESNQPKFKLITSFEDRNPFSGGVVVAAHATSGRRSLRIDRSYVSLEKPQVWLGYDFLKVNLFTSANKPLGLDVEIRDTETKDYWTRVNYSTIVPPGKSTLVIPAADEPVGDDLSRAAENAEAYRRAFPKAPPYFTGASSFTGSDRQKPHFRLARGPAHRVVERPRRGQHQSAPSLGERLGVLQRRQPLDLRNVHVQGSQAVRDEIPAFLALERGGGRPLLCARLSRRRLRLVQRSPDGRLIPAVEFERLREGLDDYRRLITLDALVKQHSGAPAPREPRGNSSPIEWAFQAGPARPRCAVPA